MEPHFPSTKPESRGGSGRPAGHRCHGPDLKVGLCPPSPVCLQSRGAGFCSCKIPRKLVCRPCEGRGPDHQMAGSAPAVPTNCIRQSRAWPLREGGAATPSALFPKCSTRTGSSGPVPPCWPRNSSSNLSLSSHLGRQAARGGQAAAQHLAERCSAQNRRTRFSHVRGPFGTGPSGRAPPAPSCPAPSEATTAPRHLCS